MIDWVTAKIPFPHPPIKAGLRIDVCPNGEVERTLAKRLQVRGSHEASISVRSYGAEDQNLASHLLIDGNPSKFLQGHNAFGSDDLISLITDTVRKIAKALELNIASSSLKHIEQGDYEISRLDINYSWQLPSRGDVRAWIRAAEFKSKTRHGRPSSRSGTLYWGKHSKRWSLKAYSKGDELESTKAHRLPIGLEDTPIKGWTDNKLRIELTLRSNQLREMNAHLASYWTEQNIKQTYDEYIGKLEMNEQMALSSKQLLELPNKLRSTYILWSSGHDLRSTLPKNTYYRHRRELLEYNIDINIRVDQTDTTNVVPLVKVLEAVPCNVPHWAFEKKLVHQSARRAIC